MSTTIIYKDRVSEVADAVVQGDNLWLPIDTLHSSTDWELTPEGACMGEMCIPIPAGREGEFLTEDGTLFNLPALERYMSNPVVHNDTHSVWLFGEGAAAGAGFQDPLQAPDFTLPDLEGNLHSLSDFRGKKVFLVSWASW
ncbi:MAG: redoxin domain-containing protein [Chloroflexi bacterium]|nr:redoxin domain-containing protein [Chloroflexota bacterium]